MQKKNISNKINKKRLEYWNSRSKMGYKAGSGDTNLKKNRNRSHL